MVNKIQGLLTELDAFTVKPLSKKTKIGFQD